MTCEIGLLFHFLSISSFYKKFHEEIVKLKEIFKQNLSTATPWTTMV